MASDKIVRVLWFAKEKRWAVRYWWEGRYIHYFTWKINSGQVVQFTKKNKSYANLLADHIRVRMAPNEQGISTFSPAEIRTGKKDSLFAFERYAKIWLKGCRERVKTRDLSKEYVEHLERYNRIYWTPKLTGLDVREINEPVIKQFYLWLSKKGLSKKYIQNIMDGLKQLLTEAYRKNRLQVPEFPSYKAKKKQHKKITWLSEEDQDQVIEHVPDPHKPIAMMLAYHGLRMAEARFLKRSDMDLKKGIATIRTLKGGPDREILLDPAVIKAIKTIPPTLRHPYVFHNQGKPYSKTTLWKIIREALNKAGFSNVTPSQFGRHSHASHILQRGGSTRLAQKILGHADIRTTERYTHCLTQDQMNIRRGK